jgi:hypothetical protein
METTIKISNETLAVLKNFARLRSSIIIDEGNEISVISTRSTFLATAVIEEEFPFQFAIYDLNRFLSALSLTKNPELVFSENDNFVVIKGEDGHLMNYGFGDIDQVKASNPQPPSKRLDLPSKDVTFSLGKQQIEKVKKTASVLSLPDIVVSSSGDGDVYLGAADVSNPMSDRTQIKLEGATGGDAEFNLVFSSENIENLMAIDYSVSISQKKLSHFTAQANGYEIDYWIAADFNSTYKAEAA